MATKPTPTDEPDDEPTDDEPTGPVDSPWGTGGPLS